MDNLDNKTKGILLGVGVAALLGVGVVAVFASSEEARKKSKAVVNRQRAKQIVNNKLNGSKKAKKMVDKMSDDEINNLLSTADKASNLENQFSDAVGEVESFFKKQGNQIANVFK